MRALLALLALGGLVLLHELAHLIAARLFGTRAVLFSFGVGPRLLTFRALGQRWGVGALPFGGWLRLEGENPHDVARPSGVPFAALSPMRRLAIFAAGPLGSWGVAVLLMAGLFTAGTHRPVPMTVGLVEPASEAARAQLRPGDRILGVDGEPVGRWTDLAEVLGARVGEATTLRVEREGRNFEVQVRPEAAVAGRGRIGVGELYAFQRLPPGRALRAAVDHSGLLVERLAKEMGQVLAQPWTGTGRGHTVGSLVWRSAQQGGTSLDALVRALAALSVALALFFLLPLPALDGGRMLLTLWEAFRRKPLDARIQTTLQLLSLMAAVAAVGWLALGEVRQVLAVSGALSRPP
jgi:regulator of sigma E protease